MNSGDIETIKEDVESIKKKTFTDKEIEEIRLLLEQDRRAKWLWASMRTWILAISSMIALLTVGLDGIKLILKRLVA